MARKAAVKYRSLRSNLVHLPLSLFAHLAQQQARPQSLIIHLSPLSSSSSSSRQPKPAYLGWSGLAAASSLSQAGDGLESIEVDPEVAMSLGWSENTLLEISIIHNPARATSVSVTPLSSDDWEILEQHASFLEDHLLSQLRAAQKGQEIDVWVMGKTKIRIRVEDTNPSTSTKEAVLLNNDTEVYVAPKPRGMIQPKQQVIEPSVLANGTQSRSNKQISAVRLRMIPPRVVSDWGHLNIPSTTTASQVGICSSHTVEKIRRKWRLKPSISDVNVSLELDDDETEADTGDQEKQDLPNGEGGEKQAGKRQVDIQLVVWDEMPDGYISLIGTTEEWESAWRNVKITPLLGTKGKTRRKGTFADVSPQSPNQPASPSLPGTQHLIDDVTTYLSHTLSTRSSRPLLLQGNKGSGKTTIAKIVGKRSEADRSILAEPIYADVAKLDPESRLTTLKKTMSSWIENTETRRPCCLILDGLDNLIGVETELNSSSNPAILADHFCRLFSPASLPPDVLVIVTATNITTLHPMLTAKHIFGQMLKIPPLTKETRQEILQLLVEHQPSPQTPKINRESDREDDVDYVTLGGMTEGYSISDLVDLVGNAVQQGIVRSIKSGDKPELTMEDFTLAQEAFIPLNLRGVALQKSDVKWSDIGGLHEPRRLLRETLEWPTKYAQIFANCPLRLRSGLLLYGYPGCGKTLLASAVARECGLNFISVKGPEILNKYIGASEKAVRDLFERASGAKPCVLFFDEFDSVAPKRGHDSTGVTDRVVNQLLTEMDGAQGLSGVYVLAATSRPDLVDPALLRPGRLDKSILCDMPTPSDRKEILQSVAKKLHLAHDVDWDELGERTEGMSGADLQAVVYNAHLEVVHSTLDSMTMDGDVTMKGKGKVKENGIRGDGDQKNYRQLTPKEEDGNAAVRSEMINRMATIGKNAKGQGHDKPDALKDKQEAQKPTIHHHHLLASLESTRPSVSPADRRRLQMIYRSFISDRDGKMGDGDLGRGTGTRMSLM
ncbi:peroxin-1 [Kwoniella mangroviensis CBS 8886]|nr:peroxin-1 [Kwoniella mangroviensis CBS 8886]